MMSVGGMGMPLPMVFGPTVKGAPYSGEEVSESTQVLGDGTRIHNQRSTQVYRDSEGRMRRETPDEISIWDPVQGVSYTLDPKTQTARKAQVKISQVLTGDGKAYHISVMQGDRLAMTDSEAFAAGKKAGAEAAQTAAAEAAAAKDRKLAEMHAETSTFSFSTNADPTASGVLVRKLETRKGQTESLGKQFVEGVESEGTKTTSTIEAGSIGNDRPIQITSERWYSPELQVTMMTKHSDPRSGEETFRLMNVRRGEPGAYLFQLPSGYQVQEMQHRNPIF
jgi:hypothetical protein